MDNLTHSAIGLVLGHAISRRPGLRRAATWTAVLASNLPDIDLVTRPFFEDGKLGYLVHHRGHTHTLVVALLLSPLASRLGAWIGGRPRASLEAADRRELGLVAGAGVLLHIGADAMNNYGVHPFWPLVSDWFYGDRIFIVEPLLLAALLPYATASATGRGSRWAWGLTTLAVVAASFALPGVPLGSGIAVAALAAVLLMLQRSMERLGLTIGVALTVLLSFFFAGTVARGRASGAVVVQAHRTPAEMSLTPMPANPLCWSFLARFGHESHAGLYAGAISLWPALLPSAECAFPSTPDRTAPLTPMPEGRGDVAWEGSVQSWGADLSKFASDCRVAAFLRFGRMPFWFERDGVLILGDLRYDFEPELGFAELALRPEEAPADCSVYLAPWIPEAGQALGKGPSAADR